MDCSSWANTGNDFQGIRAQDTYEPKRYFSFLTDTHLRTLVEIDFIILDFEAVDLSGEEEPGFFQAATLRRLDRAAPGIQW